MIPLWDCPCNWCINVAFLKASALATSVCIEPHLQHVMQKVLSGAPCWLALVHDLFYYFIPIYSSHMGKYNPEQLFGPSTELLLVWLKAFENI